MDVTPLGGGGDDEAGEILENQLLVLGEAQNLPAFDEGLTGVEAGDQREIAVTYPAEFPREDLRGRTLRFGCAVKEVRQKNLPEIDDAFAAQVADGKTLLELRGEIRRHLEQEAEARISREMDEQIVDRLVERHDVEVPPSLVEQYLASSVEELHARNLQAGRPSSDEEDQRFREMTRPVAERVLRGMFVMEAVRRQEEIDVGDEAIEARIVEIANESGFDLEKYREYVAQGDEREKIRHGLEERQTFDFLLSRAKIEPVPADAEIAIGQPVAAATKAAPADETGANLASGQGERTEGEAENQAQE
jgi:trigger factor